MLHGRDIVCLSSIDWDASWQGHQGIMSRLAAAGNRVIFVESTGVRRPGLRDLPRLAHRLDQWGRGADARRPHPPNITVLSPLALPFPYWGPAVRANAVVVGRLLRRCAARLRFREPIAWTFLPTPLSRRLLQMVGPALTVYHCVDDFASSSPGAARIRPSEEAVFRESDLVLVTSEGLRERASRFSSRVHVFPSGVDFERFEAARLSDAPIPPDLAKVPRPVVGYVGGLHRWVDIGLLAAVADALPDVSFACIGPSSVDVGALQARRNVHLIGPRSHEQVPAYVKGFSAALIPYVRSQYTENVYPAKLNEYLAMGVPVVSTDLPEIRRFGQRHEGVVRIGGSAGAFTRAIREVLGQPDTPDAVNRRIAVARANGWTERLARMCTVIEAAERGGRIGVPA